MAESNKNFICDCCKREMSLENAVELAIRPVDITGKELKRNSLICEDCAKMLFLMVIQNDPYEE